jgi:hypothetical protein
VIAALKTALQPAPAFITSRFNSPDWYSQHFQF